MAFDWNTLNANVIEAFRKNDGQVGDPDTPTLLLLHTVGAKTGQPRVNPLTYRPRGDDFVIAASAGGSPTNPDWFHNLIAHPRATVEVGTEIFTVDARVATGDERDRVWRDFTERHPTLAEYAQNVSREIPVFILERTG